MIEGRNLHAIKRVNEGDCLLITLESASVAGRAVRVTPAQSHAAVSVRLGGGWGVVPSCLLVCIRPSSPVKYSGPFHQNTIKCGSGWGLEVGNGRRRRTLLVLWKWGRHRTWYQEAKLSLWHAQGFFHL